MRREVVHTDKVPPARVPLSQGIKAGDWVFASGQLGNDPQTRKLAAASAQPGRLRYVASAAFIFASAVP